MGKGGVRGIRRYYWRCRDVLRNVVAVRYYVVGVGWVVCCRFGTGHCQGVI